MLKVPHMILEDVKDTMVENILHFIFLPNFILGATRGTKKDIKNDGVQNRSPMHIKRPKMLMFQVGEF
jgi:hypothetical protein